MLLPLGFNLLEGRDRFRKNRARVYVHLVGV